MTSPIAPKDKFFEKVINPYLAEVPQHPETIEMCEELLHIRDVEGPRRTGSVETRLEALEQQVFKCQGMLERGINASHKMISEFTNNYEPDAKNTEEAIFKLQETLLGKGLLMVHWFCLLMAHYWCATSITPLVIFTNGAPLVRH